MKSKTKFAEVKAPEWEIATFLPLAQFEKATKQKIYADSSLNAMTTNMIDTFKSRITEGGGLAMANLYRVFLPPVIGVKNTRYGYSL